MKNESAVIVLASLVFVFVVGFASYFIKSARCDNQAVSFEAYEYKLFGGCMVKHKGRWLPLENIRGFDDK